ncbi:hypothetical protein [Hyperthermus butylicus]|uniref:Uncharacterized protein n=1 Tax=Hyperthermus butylicus (strain DSM 5456 / JCM 9403 / PLM1-5) TaxID=415426 RepID=A2BLH7_HYPBU|nr:hypothetical protein [Hyperthermus butylicus]ABM80838.1 hypothetical protein Hbut_0991 [Hyperthermus butylicus DSM 5456]
MPKGSRRLIPVSERLVEELTPIARRAGMSVPELVETILSQAVRILRSRDDVASVLSDSAVLADVARLGMAPVPLEALARVLERAEDDAVEEFTSSVARLASLVAASTRARGLDDNFALAMVLRALLPGMAVDIVDEGKSGKIVVASPVLSGSRIRRFVHAIVSGVVEGFGLAVNGGDESPGLVVVRFKAAG